MGRDPRLARGKSGSGATLTTATPSLPGLTTEDARARLARDGPNAVPEAPRHPLRDFARRFWGISAWMIELIAVLSLALGKYVDAGVAAALLAVNAVLGFLQEQRAGAAVEALRKRLQVGARVLRDGEWRAVPAAELVAGDVVRVRAGDFVPADARILEGEARLDESALTGESRDVARAAGGELHSGAVVRRGEATAVVTATGTRTYFGRTTELVQSAHPALHVEAVVARLVRWLFVIVGILVAVAFVASVAEGLPLAEIVPLSLVLLMSAVPVALPVMFTVTMAVGAMQLGRRGVLVTRLNAAEDAASMDVLCVDKTGTLTMNRLALVGTLPVDGHAEGEVIRDGALASHEADRDPIDLAFLGAARERAALPAANVLAFTPFSPESRRTEARIEMDGHPRTVVKGAWRTVAELAGLEAQRLAPIESAANAAAAKGQRVLAVAAAEGEGPMQLLGLAFLADAVRPDSRELLDKLRALSVDVQMITGDARAVAQEVAQELGIREVFAEVFPEGKFDIVKRLQTSGRIVGMTGDGGNDAPALKQAEVGIAVAGATDAAKGAASVVLTTEGLASIVELVTNGRSIYQRVLTWIVNKVSRTILKSGFVVIAFLATGKFVISAMGMMLLVFLDDYAKIALATDRVRPSPRPETWRIGPLVRVAAILGVLMLLESLGFLAAVWKPLALAARPRALDTLSFLMLLFLALFSLVSIRERRPFWSSRPSALLAAALLADGLIGVAIGVTGFGELGALPLAEVLAVLGFAIAASVFNDFVKTVLIARWR